MLERPLSDADYGELDAFLMAEGRPRDIMGLSMLDGFLTALLIGPKAIAPSRWLPEVWGQTPDDPMRFASEGQARRILELIMKLHDGRARDLAEGVDIYDPLIGTREEDGKSVPIIDDWCAGFMRGVMLNPEGWDPLFQSEEDAALLTPMILHGTESGARQLEANPSLKARHREIADVIGICVIGIRDHWLPARQSASALLRARAKVGRNDPCPCGSGKKFKKCHGSAVPPA